MPAEWRGVDRWRSGVVNDIGPNRTFFGSDTSSMASTERPLLEVVTVVSRGTNIFWNVVACPPRASERVQGRSAGGDNLVVTSTPLGRFSLQ